MNTTFKAEDSIFLFRTDRPSARWALEDAVQTARMIIRFQNMSDVPAAFNLQQSDSQYDAVDAVDGIHTDGAKNNAPAYDNEAYIKVPNPDIPAVWGDSAVKHEYFHGDFNATFAAIPGVSTITLAPLGEKTVEFFFKGPYLQLVATVIKARIRLHMTCTKQFTSLSVDHGRSHSFIN